MPIHLMLTSYANLCQHILINGAQFITHVTLTRFYQDAMLQTAEDLNDAVHFNNTV
jgi:hypothetical protein